MAAPSAISSPDSNSNPGSVSSDTVWSFISISAVIGSAVIGPIAASGGAVSKA